MTLTLDIGNSAVKGGVFAGDELVHVFHLEAGGAEPGSEAAVEMWVRALREEVEADAVDRVGLASVVPDAVPTATAALKMLTGAEPVVIHPDMSLPFRLDYETPQTLGTDRLAAAAAAWVRYGRPADGGPRSVLAVDAGTAVTYEVIHRDGVYTGGVIGAGPVLTQRALRSGTAQLPSVPLTFPDHPAGTSTQTAMQSGIMWGFVDGVRGMVARLAATLPDAPVLVVTGGWSSLLHTHLDAVDHVVPHLVLDGVRVLMEE